MTKSLFLGELNLQRLGYNNLFENRLTHRPTWIL